MLAAIDGGRLKEYADDGAEETRLFWRQLDACAYEVRPGPGKLLGWGVDDPRIHDDLLLSLALVGAGDVGRVGEKGRGRWPQRRRDAENEREKMERGKGMQQEA